MGRFCRISEAVDLQRYSLDLGTVSSNSAVYAFFGANRVAGSTIPQQWFVDQGIPLTEDVLSADFDGDGLSNADEYFAGTKANDAASGLKLAAEGLGTQLRWESEWNHWYELDVSTNLLSDPFHQIDGPLPGEYDVMQWNSPNAEGDSIFYRVRVVPASEQE